LEIALGIRCFDRRADGYRLTDAGRKLFEQAEVIEANFAVLSSVFDAEDRGIEGLVRITANETVSQPFLIPLLSDLQELHPGIRIELIIDNRSFSLARREADIALRMVRPEDGDLLARRVAIMAYGLFVSDALAARLGTPRSVDDLSQYPTIDWTEDYPKVATVHWFRQAAAGAAVLRVNRVAERRAAAINGLGLVCLPLRWAEGTALKRVLPEIAIPPAEVWLVTHPETARVPRVRAVMDFIGQRAADQARMFDPR
jgi:DNA-binding transcriptional LysR family regulator